MSENLPQRMTETLPGHVMAEGDPEAMIAILEKKAELANRLRIAIEKVVVSQTYAEDWSIQGEGDKARACLGSAGTERIGRNFPITYRDVAWTKEEFSDDLGDGYRYVYTGYATLNDRTVYAEGSYSTRDEFLSKAQGKWRPLEEINEGDIRSAAHHIFCGAAIKELLGLRAMPVAQYQRIMASLGRDATKTTVVNRTRGTQGGTSADDAAQQKELAETCIAIANACMTVEKDEQGNWGLVPIADSDGRDMLDIAKDICERLSSFTNAKGEDVKGRGAKALQGKWLGATLGKARKLKEGLDRKVEEGPDDAA
jgi:hypothetical protein